MIDVHVFADRLRLRRRLLGRSQMKTWTSSCPRTPRETLGRVQLTIDASSAIHISFDSTCLLTPDILNNSQVRRASLLACLWQDENEAELMKLYQSMLANGELRDKDDEEEVTPDVQDALDDLEKTKDDKLEAGAAEGFNKSIKSGTALYKRHYRWMNSSSIDLKRA